MMRWKINWLFILWSSNWRWFELCIKFWLWLDIQNWCKFQRLMQIIRLVMIWSHNQQIAPVTIFSAESRRYMGPVSIVYNTDIDNNNTIRAWLAETYGYSWGIIIIEIIILSSSILLIMRIMSGFERPPEVFATPTPSAIGKRARCEIITRYKRARQPARSFAHGQIPRIQITQCFCNAILIASIFVH